MKNAGGTLIAYLFRRHYTSAELILEKLAAGESIEQLLEAHPRLSREAIYEALDFAVKALRADVVYPLTSGST